MPIAEPTHLSTREAQEALRFRTPDGTIGFLRRKGVVPLHRGRHLLWSRLEVLAQVAGGPDVHLCLSHGSTDSEASTS